MTNTSLNEYGSIPKGTDSTADVTSRDEEWSGLLTLDDQEEEKGKLIDFPHEKRKKT
jgi:hypothetical protein